MASSTGNKEASHTTVTSTVALLPLPRQLRARVYPKNRSWARKRGARYWCAWEIRKTRDHLIGDESFFEFAGALGVCAYFRGPTAISRLRDSRVPHLE